MTAPKKPTHAIIGSNARTLEIVSLRGGDTRLGVPVRASGSKPDMQRVLAAAVREWFRLPAGSEIETIAARLMPPALRLAADETIDKTKPAPPPGKWETKSA